MPTSTGRHATRKLALRRLVKDLLDRAFDGSTQQLVLQALSARKPSAEELAQIRRAWMTWREVDHDRTEPAPTTVGRASGLDPRTFPVARGRGCRRGGRGLLAFAASLGPGTIPCRLRGPSGHARRAARYILAGAGLSARCDNQQRGAGAGRSPCTYERLQVELSATEPTDSPAAGTAGIAARRGRDIANPGFAEHGRAVPAAAALDGRHLVFRRAGAAGQAPGRVDSGPNHETQANYSRTDPHL